MPTLPRAAGLTGKPSLGTSGQEERGFCRPGRYERVFGPSDEATGPGDSNSAMIGSRAGPVFFASFSPSGIQKSIYTREFG